ncbi:MAG: VWA domain-containing protein [Verrucomicrobiae bacterium]|nr:VWA domain-containing protein [Verrucomicrobiae bacterium]
MSLHADLSPEAIARLAAQKRKSTISSIVIALLVVVLIGLLLGFILLPALEKENPVIVTYESNYRPEDELQEKKVQTTVQRKPSAPSASMAKVITANTVADVSIPVPDVDVPIPSMDFGDGDDFGSGWGDGSGFGGGGGASFFQQEVKAERVAYVIDYSLSMSGQRDKLMRKELTKSISKLPAGMKYQMIFFAGPSWIAGSEVKMAQNRKSAVVSDGRYDYDWESGGKGAHGWDSKGRSQRPDWIQADAKTIEESLATIKGTELVWGTTWEPALDLALKMDPAPQVIFFMTDGVTGGDLDQLVRRLTNRAKTRDIKINTVAMMEPKAHGAMKDLAKRTGGMFTIIEKGGDVRTVPLD